MLPKVGLDDYLAGGGSMAGLVGMVKPVAVGLQAIEDEKPTAAVVLGADTRKTRTNTGSMNRLKELFGGRFAWDSSTGWYAWQEDRGYWKEDAEHYVRAAITNELPALVNGEIEHLKKKGVSESEIGKHYAYWLNTQAAGHQRDTLGLLQVQMLQPWQDYDNDLDLLTVGNGTLVFEGHSVILKDWDPEDKITRATPVKYDPEARCPFWHSTLKRFLPDAEIRDFVQRFAGSILVGGGVRDQLIPILFGTGANGKSSVTAGIRAALGEDLAIEVDPSTLRPDTRSGSAPSPDKVRLRGARFVYAVETTGHLDAQLLKRFSGGEEIVARQLHGKTISFKPQFTLALLANDEPSFDDNSEGLWRRVRRIPFDVRIPDRERIEMSQVLKDLKKEAPGILAWMVEGWKLYARDGLTTPKPIMLASSSMRTDADHVRRFVLEHIAETEGAVLKPKDVFEVWQEWIHDEPEARELKLGATKFKQAVAAVLNAGYDSVGKVAGKSVRGWVGYSLKTAEDDGYEKTVEEPPTLDGGGTRTTAYSDSTKITVENVDDVAVGHRRVTGLPATFNFTDSEDWRKLYRKGGQ